MRRCSSHRPSSSFFFCALGAAGLLSVSGCLLPPERGSWKPEDKTVQPQSDSSQETGRLVVETAFLGIDEGTERRQRYFLYDGQGNYVTPCNNYAVPEICLPAGQYVVVSSVVFALKKVKVFIRDEMTTRVTLEDFKSAPNAD